MLKVSDPPYIIILDFFNFKVRVGVLWAWHCQVAILGGHPGPTLVPVVLGALPVPSAIRQRHLLVGHIQIIGVGDHESAPRRLHVHPLGC